MAFDWRPAPNRERAVKKVLDSSSRRLYRAPVIEGAPPRPGAGPAKPRPARVLVDHSTEVKLGLDAPRPGYLVLDDSQYPGWEASVDGRPAAIRPANAAFRAVRVPAGAHEVAFRYRPVSVLVGGILSALALIAIVAGLVFAFARDRMRRRRGSRE
jgi:hypothetical protein